MPSHRTYTCGSAQQTDEFGARLAEMLFPGDTLFLNGPLGAGKTHLARSIITTILLQPEDIPSPTYTLVQQYETAKGVVWHADLYRLHDIDDVEELGLIDAMEDCICIVEWPDRLGDWKPKNLLDITIAPSEDPDSRVIEMTTLGERWSKELDV